tara:strand:+ start:21 stop:197 length:177 start_codon:yes stop_codon:yes gene_type:complete
MPLVNGANHKYHETIRQASVEPCVNYEAIEMAYLPLCICLLELVTKTISVGADNMQVF